MRTKLTLIIFIKMLLCSFGSSWANNSFLNVSDSIIRVEMSDLLLDLFDDYSDRIDFLYAEIVQKNVEELIDEQTHRGGCSWLVEFDNTGDTLWFTLTLVDPWLSTIVKERFAPTKEMIPKISFQGISRNGLNVYLEESKNYEGLYTQTNESIPIDKDSSYFEYGLVVGGFYYFDNTITKTSLLVGVNEGNNN